MATTDVTVLICGGGNGAHVLAGLASSFANTHVQVLTLYDGEADRWNEAMKNSGFRLHMSEKGHETKVDVAPFLVTNDPATAIARGVDIIVLVVPAFAHFMYLEALKPYIKPGMVILGLPGQSGFEFAVWGVLGTVSRELTIINAESLPWACRIRQFGMDVDVLGTKLQLIGAIAHGKTAPKMEVPEMVKLIWGDKPELITKGDLLGMTLMCANAYVHPSFMYAKWADWDGKPVEEAPLFYHGADDITVQMIDDVTNEVMQIAGKVKEHHPKLDFCNLVSIYDLCARFYEKDIEDTTNLKTVFLTNKAYTGLRHPMIETKDGKYVPNFKYRYLTEDIPYGLVVMRGIAEIAGVVTPVIDKLILWSQDLIGKEYLKDGFLTGNDVKSSRAPQAFGFSTVEELVQSN